MSLVKAAEKADSLATFQHIPIVDLEHLASTGPVRRELADEIREACVNVGFLYVKNHGIPEEIIQDVLAASKEFFSLSIESKMELDNRKSPNFKGYSALLSGNNDPENNGDLQEGFEFGMEALDPKDNANIGVNDGVMAGANVWPSNLPGFRLAVLKYYHAAVNLGKLLFPLFALALNLPEDFFDDKTKNSAAMMRVLYYPPQTGPVDDRVIGIGAHTDWECFTILWQEPGIQALQILNADKQWVNAPPIPGTLVINLGDQISRWTNDVFKSAIHRAINRSGAHRYSIPLFFGTDYDVKLETLPSCISPERPAKYEVVTSGEYIKSKLKATYGH